MRRLTLAIALACILSGAAYAGEVPSTGVVTPPPPPSTVSATGEIHSTGATAPEEWSSLLTIILTFISIGR